jgi:hypothetical protein
MSHLLAPESIQDALRRVAGYLNFSLGPADIATLKAFNEVYATATAGDPLRGMPAWLVVKSWVETTLDRLHAESNAFANIEQAQRVLRLVWVELLPQYMDFHRDQLFHQRPELLYNGFMLARACGAVLSAVHSDEDAIVVQTAIDEMDDYVGYRPVAVLENTDGQPYRHEFVSPVPLYIRGAGVSAGPYCEILTLAIEYLHGTNPDVLRAASFHLDRLFEIAIDPRAYDFDHPVNRRPNYHFGQWDDRKIDADGYYSRFVVRSVTLDSLLSRLQEEPQIARREAMREAAIVLAGTILMGSGISGWGPGAYDSSVTLVSLMKPIAMYRDEFYSDHLNQIDGEHGARLKTEAERRHQPFGGVRQHLNAALARRRAAQVQFVQLARLYARMGYPDSATKQADKVAAASARLMCRIDCLMTLGLRSVRAGDLETAATVPREAFALIQRSIQCGALIDPRDILGYGGSFSLYPGPESSVHDTRVDDILYLIEQLFGYIARIWSEAAARDDAAMYDAMEACYRDVADWWRKYAAHTVESIEATDPLESYDSAKLVARALRYWHQGGAAAGDVKFWASHAEWFDSPRAYALVISALLERSDFVSSMALLVHWMSQADRVGLRSGGSSLARLSERWLLRLRASADQSDAKTKPEQVWLAANRFFDHLEANAATYWSAPRFKLSDPSQPSRADEEWEQRLAEVDEDGSEASLYDAAYEDMSYRDTTDDGNEGSVFNPGGGEEASFGELEIESKRLSEHLNFLQSMARMWAVAANMALTSAASINADSSGGDNQSAKRQRIETLSGWADLARRNRIGLLELLESVRSYAVNAGGSDRDSMRSYDRLRVMRDALMERIIGTAVETSDSRRLICAAIWAMTPSEHKASVERDQPLRKEDPLGSDPLGSDRSMGVDDAAAVQLLGALLAGDTELVHRDFPAFVENTLPRSLLYIPLSRGGDPVKIFVARLRQRLFQHLLHWLPRRGLITEACRLIETAREMEQNNPIGLGAVTEFDSLFKAGFRSLVQSLVDCVKVNDGDDPAKGLKEADSLIPLLERLTEVMLASWLAHSQTLRLSPLEIVNDNRHWNRLVEFIKTYGDPIFTQTFLQLGNVRAILHQGVFDWLKRVVEEDDPMWRETRLVEDLNSGRLKLEHAERWITTVYSALIDHHAEYMDYNSTTTQSDRGDMIYMFLDFLRLRARYERIAWNLKPVMWAHEILVRSEMESSAIVWRRSLSDQIGKEADTYVQELRHLQTQYAMRMPTVADRILERFVQPMTIDRMRALVLPAMRDAEVSETSTSFQALEAEAELLTRTPCGVGLDVPLWIDSLEEEVEKIAKAKMGSEIDPQELVTITITKLATSLWNEQLDVARSHGRRLPYQSEPSDDDRPNDADG